MTLLGLIGDRPARISGSMARRLRQMPGPRQIEAYCLRQARARWRSNSAFDDDPIVRTIERTGIYLTSFSDERTLSVLPEVLKLNPRLQSFTDQLPRKTGHVDRLDPCTEAAEKLYLAGLERCLLRLAEDYIGLSPIYLGAELKRENPDGIEVGTRQWHLDVEDRRVFKVIVYLNDVDVGGGPFEFFDKGISEILIKRLRYRSGFLPTGLISAETEGPPTVCHGAAGTVILFDGARLFHRSQVAFRAERLSLTFTYASKFHWQVFPEERPTVGMRKRVVAQCPDLIRHLPRVA